MFSGTIWFSPDSAHVGYQAKRDGKWFIVIDAADRLGRKQAETILREHFAAFGIPPDSEFYTKVLRWSR